MNSAEHKMMAARTSLVLEQPFWGSLILSLEFRADLTCKTAWVDGRTLGYNPAFIESLTHDRIVALQAHEVSHCALGHPWRRDARDLYHWNLACDKAINTDLRASGFTLPENVFYAEGEEIGKSAEWIFARLDRGNGDAPQEDSAQEGEQDAQDGDGGAGDPLGEVRDAPKTPDADGDAPPSEQDWKQRTIAAAQQAKMQGKLPGGMARLVSQAMKPKIDVRSLLLRFFSERSTGDYSWTRPNTRYLSQGLYLPALESRALGEVAIMIDTSGSVDDVALGYARNIVQDVLDECNPTGTTLVFADADVKHTERVEQGAPLTWEPQGGGGTDFCPALEYIDKDGQFACVVCISDLAGTFPDAPPALPILWLSTEENAIAPFGETVFIDH
jgi:predicted metal-dependent peptidase